MLVETYEQTEVSSMTPDECEGGLALVKKLGLSKQDVFYAADRRAVPWLEITPEQKMVYGLLCPVAQPLPEYDAGPVPVRVLEVAERALESGFFTAACPLKVWRPESLSDIRLDPFLVGYRQDKTLDWRQFEYPLARWGDALDTWDVMLKKAKEIARVKLLAVRAEIDRDIEALSNYASHRCGGRFTPYYSRQFRD